MTKELWKKCAKTDYSKPYEKSFIERYVPELAAYPVTTEDIQVLYAAINLIEGVKLKYK